MGIFVLYSSFVLYSFQSKICFEDFVGFSLQRTVCVRIIYRAVFLFCDFGLIQLREIKNWTEIEKHVHRPSSVAMNWSNASARTASYTEIVAAVAVERRTVAHIHVLLCVYISAAVPSTMDKCKWWWKCHTTAHTYRYRRTLWKTLAMLAAASCWWCNFRRRMLNICKQKLYAPHQYIQSNSSPHAFDGRWLARVHRRSRQKRQAVRPPPAARSKVRTGSIYTCTIHTFYGNNNNKPATDTECEHFMISCAVAP